MDLVLLNREGLEFVIVLDDRSGASTGFRGILGVRSGALMPPGAVAVGQLRYRGYSLGSAFRPLLAGHRGEQAQVVAFNGNAATPWLEITNGAMPIQYKWGLFLTEAVRPDLVDGLTRRRDLISNPHISVTGAIAVDEYSCVCQYASILRQRERAETEKQSVRKARLIPGYKQGGNTGAQ
jgi:hypothetical protein